MSDLKDVPREEGRKDGRGWVVIRAKPKEGDAGECKIPSRRMLRQDKQKIQKPWVKDMNGNLGMQGQGELSVYSQGD